MAMCIKLQHCISGHHGLQDLDLVAVVHHTLMLLSMCTVKFGCKLVCRFQSPILFAHTQPANGVQIPARSILFYIAPAHTTLRCVIDVMQTRQVSGTTFLEACIENSSKGPMCLEYVRFDATPPLVAHNIDVRDAMLTDFTADDPLDGYVDQLQASCNPQTCQWNAFHCIVKLSVKTGWTY